MLRGEYKEDVEFLLSLVPDWAKKKPSKGYMPSSYGTGEYESDLIVYERVQEIQEKFDTMDTWEHKCPNCGNEDLEYQESDMECDYYDCLKCGTCISVYSDGDFIHEKDCVDPVLLENNDD
jgi:predicted RNA-binding Zn-ribbon protein involved in translation (DUF1610 family)